MRIAFLGNFRHYHCSEVHHAHTLEQLGHEVRRIQEGSDGNAIINSTRGADLFVWVHSHGAPPSSYLPIGRVLSHLRGFGMPMITYHLDLYYGIPSRFNEYREHPYMTGLDHFFSVDPPLVDWLNTHTATKGHYLTAGVLADECYMAEKDTCPQYPVIFVGSYQYHKEWPYRAKLIDWLKETYRSDFTGWGPQFSGVVRGEDLNRLYANSKIVVGDSYSPDFDYPGYWSDRIPETLGRGGFLIHPRIKGIEDFYTDREHLVLYDFGDFEQLEHLIGYYLDHENEREAIRRAGHQHVKDHHTFTHRWTQILDLVKQ
jgi:hypothetical protein